MRNSPFKQKRVRQQQGLNQKFQVARGKTPNNGYDTPHSQARENLKSHKPDKVISFSTGV